MQTFFHQSNSEKNMSGLSQPDISFQNLLHGRKISTSKQVQMIQKMVEMIQVQPVGIARLQRHYFPVSVIESPGKSSEKLCHCKIGLSMSHISRRIDQPHVSVRSRHHISGPQIAMQQGRLPGLIEYVLQLIQQSA